jgi:hypothetical protein
MVAAMAGIQDSSRRSRRSSRRSTIAFQTNILALNAAVEAGARARRAWASPWLPTKSAACASVGPSGAGHHGADFESISRAQSGTGSVERV